MRVVSLVLQVDGGFSALSWSVCFIPLFAADALNAYFTLIIFIRFYAIKEVKPAGKLPVMLKFSIDVEPFK